jgi:4-phospho-D-threonate 3-dehydrogenase / 4-phospho-D-erythronate 3-dehydrogenase
MNNIKRPILGITMGDPAGNGPEITVKALSRRKIYKASKPLVIGDARVMQRAVKIVNMETIKINPITNINDARFEYGTIDVFNLDLVDLSKLVMGKVSAMAGEAAFQCVKKVIELAMSGQIDGTVTNALSKEAINLAGHHYAGHTEIYAGLTGTKKYSMMLAYKNIRVVHVSTHVSLREACDQVKKDRVLDVIRLAAKTCKQLGIKEPKIGVAGLNPHSSENGMFGTEESTEIIPAIEQAKTEGINTDGPVSPDTLFPKIRGGWYDMVVCMYHDQGHIPLKVLGFVYDKQKGRWQAVEGVNITLGLPIIRASVDHGTGFGHAGDGSANELSLVNAIEYGIALTKNNDKK